MHVGQAGRQQRQALWLSQRFPPPQTASQAQHPQRSTPAYPQLRQVGQAAKQLRRQCASQRILAQVPAAPWEAVWEGCGKGCRQPKAQQGDTGTAALMPSCLIPGKEVE